VAEEGIRLRAVDYVNALLERNRFWHQVRRLYEKYDLLVTPALSVAPFRVGRNDAPPLPGQSTRALQWTGFTYPFNLTGQPACSVPCGWTGSNRPSRPGKPAATVAGLPVGLQLVGRRFDDLTVLLTARALEQIQPWAGRRPSLPEPD
jgi:aspartyl-tRNA(Asn)/glutamyl-tRNA(Gln) amidotransferase subunit A